MIRKPLPDDLSVYAFNAADMMMKLHEEAGFALKDLVYLHPQQIYDLVSANIAPEDAHGLKRVVIIDEKTGELLKRHMRKTLRRLRPDRHRVAHNEAITCRSHATERLGQAGSDFTLQQIEAAIKREFDDKAVVLEDEDSRAYGIEMNRIISRRQHGRSPELD